MPSPGKKMENGNSAWNQMVHPIPFRGKFQSLKAMLLLQCQIQVLGWGWGEGGGGGWGAVIRHCAKLFSV